MKKTILLTVIAALMLGLAACTPATSSAVATTDNTRTLSVSGTGQAFLTPDIARISIGVRTEDSSAASALTSNNKRAASIQKTLTDFGVDPKDIQTSNFSIYQSDKRDLDSNVVSTNYTVSNTVNVTVRDLETFGELLDTLVRSGANNISNIQFDVDDQTAALASARDAAIKHAYEQAEAIAAAAGVSLGDVQTITFYDPVPVQTRNAPVAEMAANASVPIQSGETSVSVTVNVVYQIK